MGGAVDRVGAVNLRSFHLGVDLGQRVDHTAFVVVEQRVVCTSRRDRVTFEFERERQMHVRLVDRVRLGTGFREVVEEVERLTHVLGAQSDLVTTSVDATGMGIVVTEDLQRHRLKGELYPVVITGGLEGSYQAGFYPTPRTELLLGVQRALEKKELKVARGVRGWAALEEEMLGMRKCQSVRGPRFETMGPHDDLVFALGLAMLGVRRRLLPTSGEMVRRRTWD
jgi:hypothetical protein